MSHWAWMFLLTLAPALELRASIPYGHYHDLGWFQVLIFCVAVNGLLGAPIWWIATTGHRFIERIPFLHRLWQRFVERGRDRIAPMVDRWGTLGLAFFIGIPLPGSGVYTGVVAAYVLGLRFRQVLWASWLGVLIAGILVTLILESGTQLFQFMIKPPGEHP